MSNTDPYGFIDANLRAQQMQYQLMQNINWQHFAAQQFAAQNAFGDDWKKAHGIPKHRYYGPTKELDAHLLAIGGSITA